MSLHTGSCRSFAKYAGLAIGFVAALAVAAMWLARPPVDEIATIPAALLPPATPELLTIRHNAAAIRPLHSRMGTIQPGDWLEKHTELGQSFDQYLVDHRQPLHERYTTLYVQPLGETTPIQRQLLDDTAGFLGRFFGFTVTLLDTVTLDDLPDVARRAGASPSAEDEQLLTTYLLDNVLKPRVPDDAVAVLGLTAKDLWAGAGWNYVFGQASLSDRIGVWSVHRFGNPEAGPEAYRVCLRRTLGTAAHETGHMFGMTH